MPIPPPPPLWSATITTAAEHIDLFADAVGGEALALSTLAPPRQKTAQTEAIFPAPPDSATLTARLAIVAMMHGIPAPTLVVRALPKLDWLKKVAADFPPLPIAQWLVHGANHKPTTASPLHTLQIDATSAFGTGEHPTTRGCLIMLDRLLKQRRPRTMLDMGCGTGILAMAYAKATHGIALGVDLDALSVLIAQDNARTNGLQKNTRFILGQGYRAAPVHHRAPYDLIMANIFARPLTEMAKDVRRFLKPDGDVILAGLLNHQAPMVIAAHRAQGIYLRQHIVIGEWSILALRRTFRA